MKKILKNTLIFSGLFAILFICGVIISDIIIIARAKYMLKIADSLNFPKNLHQLYPTLAPEQNGMTMIQNIYNARKNLPTELQQLDNKITMSALNDNIPVETLRNFWKSKEVLAITAELSSVPYTLQFSFNSTPAEENFQKQIEMLKSLHNFYLHYMKFASLEGEKLQTLHIFQKLLVLNRALEGQQCQLTEKLRMDFWMSSLETLVHYGPAEKRYEEYYKSLQMLINSLDFEYYPELTMHYNILKNSLHIPSADGKNIFIRHRDYIASLKNSTNTFYTLMRTSVLPADEKRIPPLPQDLFKQNKKQVIERLQTLIQLKIAHFLVK